MLNTVNHPSPQVPVALFIVRTLGQINKLTAVGPTPLIDWEYLQHLEQDSLGHALIEHLDQHKIQPFSQGPRRLQLHDTVHVLTGYGVDLLGETEVQAFLFGCKSRPGHIMVGLGLLYKLLWKSDQQLNHKLIWHRIQTAYLRGQQSSLEPDDWSPQELWHQPLDQVRESLDLL